MNRFIQRTLFLSLVIILIQACNSDDTGGPDLEVGSTFTQPQILSQTIIQNPSGFSPLASSLIMSTSIPTRATIRVVGKNGASSDVVKEFPGFRTGHNLDILGLYGGYNNTIELTLHDESGNDLGTSAINLETAPLLADLPANIVINTNKAAKKEGMTLVSYFGHNGNQNPQRPFIFDEFGDIRWYLTFETSNVLNNLFYDNGIERLANGNWYFGDRSSGRIYEVNMLGETIDTWDFPGYSFHHQVLEKPNGNFIVTVNKNGLSTVEDHIIEIDRRTKQIVNEWDFRQSLEQTRFAMTQDQVDWFHINAVEYDGSDNTIIVSGRTQGLVKVNDQNEVVWIMAPHEDWGTAGNGVDLNTKLLTPLNSAGQTITNQSILDGFTNDPSFEWNWYQHAPQVLPNGDIMLFDNGDNRNFSGTGSYSRAVQYKVDQTNMTIQQIWQYGKERGRPTYSRIVSDIDYDPMTNHVFFSPGAVINNGNYGKVVELNYSTKEVLFEATIFPPIAVFNITFHRTERLSLYPPDN
ncbi:aryl-sulfate sulfotransferase [Roseivirga misakiensis]|uniref:Arylsulfotransferase N-terminal domain-containing protein n=1 Tax=Roseivirga misakiensis TaxID=1563681 RepID=A0A1E5SYL0_9BACT|nr:aryl-sulfate sulfotransferase [Roseivirga misakiensis]OEK04209.1 hypothetical protein BFP71_12050 [Roseivirga misakiensis]